MKKLSYEYVKSVIEEKGCTLLSENYINSKSKLLIRCKCGNEFKASYEAMRDYKKGCNTCARKRMGTRLTIKILRDRLKDKPCKVISDYYVDDRTKLIFQCNCGNLFEREPRVVIHQNSYLCLECAYESGLKHRRKTHKEFLEEVEKLTGDEYMVISEYKGAHYKVKMVHNSTLCDNYEFEIHPTSFLKGTRCHKCDVIKKTGEGHPRYNPNLTDEDRLVRRDVLEVIRWRNAVYERNKYTCQSCFRRSTELNAHHLNSWNTHPNERFKLDNGVTLCEECHTDFHKKFGYGNNTKNQFHRYIETKALC